MAKIESTGYGIASLVLGIVSIVFCWAFIFGVVAGILGIIFYVQQRKRSPNGMAIAGLVTSIIGLVISTLYSLVWIFFLATIGAIYL